MCWSSNCQLSSKLFKYVWYSRKVSKQYENHRDLHGMVVRFTIKKTNSYVQYFSDASLFFWNYNCPRPRIPNNLNKTGWFYQVELQTSLWLTRLLDTGGDLICGYYHTGIALQWGGVTSYIKQTCHWVGIIKV